MLSISAFTELISNEVFPVTLDRYEAQPMVHPAIAREVSEAEIVDPYGHKFTTITGGAMPEVRRDGAEVASDQLAEGYPVQMKIKLISRKFTLPYRSLEKMDMRGIRAEALRQMAPWGRAFAAKKEDLVAGMFNNGALTAGNREYFDNSFDDNSQPDPYPKFIYDGLPWFDTAHPLKNSASTTFANHIASAALSATTFDDARTRLQVTNARDERNQRILIQGNTLLVPGDLESTARRVIESQGLAGTANNDLNPFRTSVRVVPWNYLSDTDGWFLGSSENGIVYYDSGAPEISVIDDSERKAITVVAECRFGTAIEDWRYWVANNVAAS